MKELFFLFLLIISIKSFSQTNYEFYGALKLNENDKTLVTYRLNFSESKGVLNGYSITDIGGQNETKNIIKGTYNKSTKDFSFYEDDILYTKSNYNKNDFCFVVYKGKLKLVENTNKIEGKFQSFYKNKKECINGSLVLIGSAQLYKKLNKINNKIQSSKKVDEKTKIKVNPLSILDSLKVNNLTRGQNLNVFSKSNSITIEVWDSKIDDGDCINLYQDDVEVLKNFKITNQKKTITTLLTAKKTVFSLEALNEGDRPGNTVMIRLVDSDGRVFELISFLKKGEKASITILKN
ncbi:MAG: hypothetical protein IM568_03470 [Flavobacterium sp.]|nr:hypothetical protein [Flavobacterium sp.]